MSLKLIPRLNGSAGRSTPGHALPTASILRISDEKVLQLLDLYRQEECLWNTNHDSYKDQMPRKCAAENIATKLNILNFGPRHVMMKFKNLRNAYSQEQKKITRHAASGVIYKPSVFWYKKMDSFIKPHLQKPRVKKTPSSMVYNVDGTEDWLHKNPQNTPYTMTTEIEENSENDSWDSQTRKRKSQDTPTWPMKVYKVDSDSDEPNYIEFSVPQTSEAEANMNEAVDESIRIDQVVKDCIDEQQRTVVGCFKELTTSLRALTSRDDVFDAFGKYIAGLLRSLPREKALEVQPQIIDLIAAAGLQHIADKEREQECGTVVVKVEKC